MAKQTDVIIIGGGVIGSSIAYNLLNEGFTGKVTVFEKDKGYEFASTPRSAGGIRQLFTTAINIQISRYSLSKYKTFEEDMEVDGDKATIDFQDRGYLFLSKDGSFQELKNQHLLQRQYQVPSQIVKKDNLLSIIPELNITDLQAGLYCAEDGYLDPYSVMQGYIRKARQLGAHYQYKEVKTILTGRNGVEGVQTTDNEIHHATIVINCAGPWGPALSEKIGLPLPVVPLKRQIIQFDIADPLEKDLPLTVDPTGVYFRHEGKHILAGFSEKVEPSINFKWKRSFFIEQLWPILANRVPNFSQAKVKGGWAGIYSHNTIDQNAIIGAHPDMSGYYLANGFSGHGMQQAPAVGKGIAELIITGSYQTLDLSPLRFARFKENDLIIEGAIV